MNVTLDTPFYAIVKGDGKLVLNTIERNSERLRLLLADRIGNGEAFPGEHIVRVGLAAQWFGQHTGGDESFPCYFVPMYPEDLQMEIDSLKPCLDDSCDGGHCSVCGGHFLDFYSGRATSQTCSHCEALPDDWKPILANRQRRMFNAVHPITSDIDRGERETMPPYDC